ncbi:hypothetical protein CJ030_MR3G009406 [Morella rubra]|uniref:Uncharacterized protein n=1 Tax=Morella rubra TaxID=262757 RepID=A0A6A1W5V7_9ROSI|nr:hypothetical protein CJ030_MR3G009406 [Morella rubra]
MGSLMAGWDSPVRDPKSVALERNRSLTKAEVGAYWRAKKKAGEEHPGDIPSSPDYSIQRSSFGDSVKKYERSNSAANTKKGFMEMESEASLVKLITKNGWWTRSNWAFLNEPPVSEGDSNSYTSQFHVAGLATSKSNAGDGINA